MRFDHKIAVITGASKGIGKAVATRLAREGATVVVNYAHGSEAADALVSELSERGLSAAAFRADVSKAAERLALIDHVIQAFGRIDILVSNAGVDHFGKLEQITEEDFSRVFSLNVAGQLFVTQAALPHMTTGGRVVLTSSISARHSVFHHTLYAASKAAVSAMVLNLARNWACAGSTSTLWRRAAQIRTWPKRRASSTSVQPWKGCRSMSC